MARGGDDLPVDVPEPDRRAVAQCDIHRVRRDGLVEVLGHAAAGVAAGQRVGIRCAGCDARAASLQLAVAAHVIGVPVGVDDEVDPSGLRVRPVGGLAGVPHEPGVDHGRRAAVQQ